MKNEKNQTKNQTKNQNKAKATTKNCGGKCRDEKNCK